MLHEELKRRPAEIIARYTLEPSLREIYVEGLIDKSIIELFIEKEKLNAVTCYEITVIDFSEEIISYPQLKSNNKERLIFFANEVLKSFNPVLLNVRCVIDADLDIVLDVIYESKFILRSDFSCIEGYILDEFTFRKIIKVGFTNFPISENVVIRELFNVLNDLFFIRCARKIHKHDSACLLSIDSAIKISKSGLIEYKMNEGAFQIFVLLKQC